MTYKQAIEVFENHKTGDICEAPGKYIIVDGKERLQPCGREAIGTGVFGFDTNSFIWEVRDVCDKYSYDRHNMREVSQ